MAPLSTTKPVIPAKAGIQFLLKTLLDSRLRGNDKLFETDIAVYRNCEA
jgi:hypothetical protein